MKKKITKKQISIKDKFKKFFKENLIGIILLLLVIIVFYVPTNYDIDCDGGLINLYNRIEVSPSYKMEGSINITYVGGRRGTIATLILSKFIDGWDAYKVSDVLIDDETYAEQLKRGKVSLKEAEQNSIYVALKAAGYDVKVKSYEVTIIHIDKEAETNLEVGDIIIDVEGKKISHTNDLSEIIESRKVGDKLNMNVTRNGRKVAAEATIREANDKKIIGIYLNPIIELEYDDNITVEFNKEANEYGSSGGLMNTLLIYNKLTQEDITKGSVISGTGVINIDGTIDEIAGVKYKLRGAYKDGADVFIVPSGNYKEALEVKEKNKMDIEIIEGKNFNQVLEVLRNR